MSMFFWETALVTATKTAVRHQEELPNSQVWRLGKLISEEPVALSPLTLCVFVYACVSVYVCVCVCIYIYIYMSVCVCVLCVCLVYIWKWKSLSCVWLFVTQWTTVHGIILARILEWVAFPFPRGSSQSRDQTQISFIAGRFFTTEPPGKPITRCIRKQNKNVA